MAATPITPVAHIFIATSLDGFIARSDGAIDWLLAANAAGEDHGYADFIAGMDAVVMGRSTFETVAGFEPWPFQHPVVVASRTLNPALLPGWLAKRVRLVRSLDDVAALAAAQGWHQLYVDGGQLIQAVLAAGWVETLTLSRLPILLGQGRPLFGPLPADLAFTHVETRAFPSGLVQSRYRRPDQARPE